VADSTHSGLAEFFRSHLRPGMTVIDIGANVGEVALAAAAAVGVSGRVIAYEPGPAAAQVLRERSRHSPQVEIRQVAVSNTCGKVRFLVDPTKSTSATLFAGVAGPNHRPVNVTVCSLDSELPTLPVGIDVIKIDAQGAEGRILEGARRLLKRDKPLLVFELWKPGLHAAETSAERLLQRLAGFGYHFHPVNGKGAIGNDERIRALLAGTLHSSALNVIGHPRRWPSRRWLSVATPAPCAIAPARRELCRPWQAVGRTPP
jgi:FkbM family methyltransferase